MSTVLATWPPSIPRWSHRWRTFAHGHWAVNHIQPTPGSVRVTAGAEGVTVLIGDGPESERWCTTVELGLDGRASVRTSASPPCVLMTPREVRMVPDGPEGTGTALLEVGDRLLMMSAEALGALPEALSAMRRAATPTARTDCPGDLLERLLLDLPVGAAAVAMWKSLPPPAVSSVPS